MAINEPNSALSPSAALKRAKAARAATAPETSAGKPSVDALKLGADRAGSLGWVKAQGSRLVDANGREVSVRGVNLGGWLVQEPWMMPLNTHPEGQAAIKDQAGMWRTVEKRFGAEKMNEIRDAYRAAWMTDTDFQRIKDAGFTTVRLPFTYANLQEPDGYKWLDWAIDRAAKHGLYTILDLHGAPGGQSDAMHTGEAGKNEFFKDPTDVDKAERMWQEVARRYADRPEVLGYDLLNEPMGAQSAGQLYRTQNELYQAIRQVDSRHVVFFEDGYKGIDTFPRPEKYGWKNVAYSVHQYNFKAKSPEDHVSAMKGLINKVERVREARNVPVFVGEFNAPGADAKALAKLVEELDRSDVPWNMWTYKVIMPHASQKNVWGVYHNDAKLPVIDVTRDSAETLLAKIAAMRTENLKALPDEVELFRDATPNPAEPKRRGWLSRVGLQLSDRLHMAVAGLVDRARSLYLAVRGK